MEPILYILIFAGIPLAIIILHLLLKNPPAYKKPGHVILDSNNDESDMEIEVPIPTPIGKNKWLHDREDFGKMEVGIVEYNLSTTRNKSSKYN